MLCRPDVAVSVLFRISVELPTLESWRKLFSFLRFFYFLLLNLYCSKSEFVVECLNMLQIKNKLHKLTLSAFSINFY